MSTNTDKPEKKPIQLSERFYHTYKGKKYWVDTQYPELVWEHIEMQGREIIYRVWGYSGGYPCAMCNSTEDIVFSIQRTGVFARCMFCNVTYPAGPVNLDENKDIAQLIKEEKIDADEARKVFKRIGEKPPTGFPKKRVSRRRKVW